MFLSKKVRTAVTGRQRYALTIKALGAPPGPKKATCMASASLGKFAFIANPVEETRLLKQVGALLTGEQGLLHIQNRGVGLFTRVALILEN